MGGLATTVTPRRATTDRAEPITLQDLPAAPRRPIRLAASAATIALLAPVYVFYSHLLGLGSNSDAAINVLEGWDMAHGRPLLDGWTQGNNSWMTNELIIYAVSARILGAVPSVIFVSHGIIYATIIVLTALLAIGPTRDRPRTMLFCAMVGAMLLHVTRDTTAWMMLSVIDHLGTSIPLMVMLMVIDRRPASWRLGLVVFAGLAWAMTSDHLALYIGVLPVVIVCGLRAYFRHDDRGAHIAMAAGALAAVPADWLFKTVVEALGGAARNNPPDAIFATVGDMPANLWETVHAIMIVFGSALFGASTADSRSEVLHLAVLATAVAGWIIAWRRLKTLGLVDQILITAITVNIVAFMLSPMPGPFYTAHEILVTLPFSVALAARLIVPRLTTLRTRAPVYAGLVLAIALLGHTLTRAPAPDPTLALTGTLQREGLGYGVSGFWQAAAVSVQSGKRVEVAAVINDGHGNVTPFWQVMREDWYDPARHDARFVVSYRHATAGTIDDLNEALLHKVFGSPQRVLAVGDFEVRVYDYNILTRLPREKLPHQLP